MCLVQVFNQYSKGGWSGKFQFFTSAGKPGIFVGDVTQVRYRTDETFLSFQSDNPTPELLIATLVVLRDVRGRIWTSRGKERKETFRRELENVNRLHGE